MTGPNVEQNGIIESTTSVALNGRIDLMAVTGYSSVLNSPPTTGGTVTLGPGSLTYILPEYDSTDTLPQRPSRSRRRYLSREKTSTWRPTRN